MHTRAEWSSSVSPALGLRLGGGRRLGGFLELDAALPRDANLAGGTITWNRLSAGLGVRYQAPLGRVLLEPGLSIDVATLWVRSRGYTVNAERVEPDVAACGHLRAGYRFGGLLVFGGARACAWPFPVRVAVGSVPGVVELPVVDASLVVGLGWEWLTGSGAPGLSQEAQVAKGP